METVNGPDSSREYLLTELIDQYREQGPFVDTQRKSAQNKRKIPRRLK